MNRFLSPQAVGVHPTSIHIEPSISARLDHGLVPGLTRQMNLPPKDLRAASFGDKLNNLSSNLGAFKRSFVEALHEVPWVRDALAIPEKLAYTAAEAIAGGEIESRTPYQAQLRNLPGPMDLAASAVKNFATDTWGTVDGVLSVVDSAAFTAVSRLVGITALTEEQLQHAPRLAAVGEALVGATDAATQIVTFNPLVEDVATSSLLGSMAAAGVTKKTKSRQAGNEFGPLKLTGSKAVGAQIIDRGNGDLDIFLGAKRWAKYSADGNELFIPDLYWPPAPVNTLGMVVNHRAVDVWRVRGKLNLNEMYKGESIKSTLAMEGSVGQAMLRLLHDVGEPSVWNVGMLQGVHSIVEKTASGNLASPFFIEGLRAVGPGKKKLNSIEVRMRRLPYGENSDSIYKDIYLGVRSLTDSTEDVLQGLTKIMFEKKRS